MDECKVWTFIPHKLTANVNENMTEIDIGHMIKNVIEYGCNFPEKSIDFLSIWFNYVLTVSIHTLTLIQYSIGCVKETSNAVQWLDEMERIEYAFVLWCVRQQHFNAKIVLENP